MSDQLRVIAQELRDRADQLDAIADAPVPVLAPVVAPVAAEEPAANDNSAAPFFEDHGAFYDFLRDNKMLGPTISAEEFQGCENIIKACAEEGYGISWVAYALATAYHETAHTMQPVHERGGKAYFTRMYDIRGARPSKAKELGNLAPGDGIKYAGRGYPQLTGKTNYAKATKKLRERGWEVDLVANPDLVMRADIAAAVMILGMKEGWFTTRDLDDDLPLQGPASLAQFVASRDIINGRDKQDTIAAYAIDFQTGLQRGGYRLAA